MQQDADAADLTQDVLGSFAKVAPDFELDREKGRFRTWLFTVARRKLINFHLTKARRVQASGGDASFLLENQPAPEDDIAQWEQEYRRQMFFNAVEEAKHQFSNKIWSVFWEIAVLGRKAENVAAEFDMSVGAAYVAKSRVLKTINSIIQKRVNDE